MAENSMQFQNALQVVVFFFFKRTYDLKVSYIKFDSWQWSPG